LIFISLPLTRLTLRCRLRGRHEKKKRD